ncbi:hypothetical protein OEA41_006494 [Lepraria neglecta]|uniref:Histidine kinase/HSP90-like ATPase domain-containing protein n=1 Tax=Lepraria neglecta TaxID=209136 RepID=A0AAD9Z7U7_9LECA|nr:hypothetical protein OEA41_006494 [Lepraria neglecta]
MPIGGPVFLRVEDGSLLEGLLQELEWRGFGPSTIVGILALTAAEETLGFLLMGLNPRRLYDEDYQRFIQLLNRQLSTSLTSALLIARAKQKQAELSNELAASDSRFRAMTELNTTGPFQKFERRNLCAQHQEHIVNDVLTVSKLDSGKFLISPIPIQPFVAAKQVLKIFDGELVAHGINLEFFPEPSYKQFEFNWVMLDPSKISQGKLAYINDLRYGGSGLGLFISRDITKFYGGEIGLSSEAGKGSTFAFYVKGRRARTPTPLEGVPPEKLQISYPEATGPTATSPIRVLAADHNDKAMAGILLWL